MAFVPASPCCPGSSAPSTPTSAAASARVCRRGARREGPVQRRSFVGRPLAVRRPAAAARAPARFEHDGPRCARTVAGPKDAEAVSRIMKLLEHELPIMFDRGNKVDYSIYAPDVYFQDPLNKFTGIGKYRQNIGFLQTFFRDSKLELHDIRSDLTPAGEDVIVSRWTLSMTAPFPWSPRLAFTGTSEYVLGESGLVERHIDVWDSLPGPTEGGLADLLAEIFGSGSAAPVAAARPEPGAVMQPPYVLLRRFAEFEVREYAPFDVVETPYAARPAGFSTLDAYLHGNSMTGEGVPRSAPVLYAVPSDPASTDAKRMAYPVPAGAPEPLDDDVRVAPYDALRVAVIRYSGSATPDVVAGKRGELERLARAAGLRPADEPLFRFAQYDAVYSLPWTRRNEVWLPLADL